MVVDLNTASRGMLLGAGLTAAEVDKIEQFRADNAVFHTTAELKKHCGFSRRRYERIKDQLTARRLEPSPYKIVEPRKYRKDRGDMRRDWDVGHIIARANRGADHPANYVPMSRAYNHKLKNLYDGVIFARLSKDRVKKAVRASRVQKQCPLTFNKALQKRKNALCNIEKLELFKEGKGKVAQAAVGGTEAECRHVVGGMEDHEVDEACLCDAEFCEWLIREWNKHYGS